MDIIKTLGIDSTVFIQFALFLVAYFSLTKLVFEPYLKILDERRKRTVGSQEDVQSFVTSTEELTSRFEVQARSINEKIKTTFDTARAEAHRKYEEIVTGAKTDAERQLKDGVAKVNSEFAQAKQNIDKEVPVIGAMVVNKLLGKGL